MDFRLARPSLRFSIWLVLGALSSYQLQSRIRADNEQNQTGNTVSAVIRQLREIEDLDYQIELSQKEIKNTKLALQEILIKARNQKDPHQPHLGEK